MIICRWLDRFVDGELGPIRARWFRRHLSRCGRCRHDLVDAVALRARLGSLAPEGDDPPEGDEIEVPDGTAWWRARSAA